MRFSDQISSQTGLSLVATQNNLFQIQAVDPLRHSHWSPAVLMETKQTRQPQIAATPTRFLAIKARKRRRQTHCDLTPSRYYQEAELND